ncbi:YtpI family protein [Metabacillus malikii]|uniref:YtpI-like protein n=1 Tax=Metabacillus malikii TaxID=1504265 RepID=A0ABT9ZFJ2_9BACI|nr:YtpI family protein [Metabacillus malikii]MDQ0231031.1 hypothetical protein [Metabacillus malikii]
MPILVIFIVISFSFYIYFRIKAYRAHNQVEKKWRAAEASIALGIFVASFGLNQLIINRSILALVVGIIFFIIGVGSSWAGFRAYKHYLPQVASQTQK